MRLLTFFKDLWFGIKTFPIAVLSSLILATFILGMEDQELFGTAFSTFAMFHFPTVLFALVFSLWLHFRDHIERSSRKSATWIAVIVFSLILDITIQSFANVEYRTAGAVFIIFFLVAAISVGILNFSAEKYRSERILYQVAIRLMLTYVFSTVLFLGLLLALGGLDLLLNVDVPNYIYFRMAVFVQVVGATLILAGLSVDLKSQDLQQEANSLIIRLFNYILIPLTAIYVLITLGYLFRSWFGEGAEAATLTWLSLGYIGFAFVTFLVGNLLPAKDNSWWSPTLKRLKLAFMMLILISMTLGTIQLISLYGFTINRLLLILFSIWFGTSMVLLFINPTQIRRVFQTLILVSIIGIFTINQVPLSSQMSRLEAIIPSPKTENSFSPEIEEEISSIVNYLINNHPSEELLANFFDIEFDTSLTTSYSKSAFILDDVLGINSVASELVEPDVFLLAEPSNIGPSLFKQSDIRIALEDNSTENFQFSFSEKNKMKYLIEFSPSLEAISFSVDDEKSGAKKELLKKAFPPTFEEELVGSLAVNNDINAPYTLHFENDDVSIDLVFTKVAILKATLSSVTFDAYIRVK
jgi:hypothetical protein